MADIFIGPIQEGNHQELSRMVGALLDEIMAAIDEPAFTFNQKETEARSRELVARGKYWIFIARESVTDSAVGFVSLYESYALYAEGAYGTIPELYVRPQWRSQSVGNMLLQAVDTFARKKGWSRLEVTTPPLPEFDRTLRFYEVNGFSITGGRKLRRDIVS